MNIALFSGILVSLISSFFFSGIEIAFLSANKIQIELKAKQGSLAGKIISYFIGRPSWFIGTTLIGNTVGLVFYGNFMAQWMVPVLLTHLPTVFTSEPVLMVIHTFLATMIILFTAEYLPKSLFMINPNQVLNILAIPFAIAAVILAPLTFTIVFLSKFVITKVLQLEYSEEKPAFGLTDLNNYLQEMQQVKHEDEEVALDTTIFHNALEFKTIRVRDCMIPRTEIVAVKVTEGIPKLQQAFVYSGHSKIIIYKQTIDDVIGYCHSSALFRRPEKIEDILTAIIIVPETTLANELMIRFIDEHKSLALVVDEFGGTSGIVSMEDVIEEIFGDIEDEHDENNLIEIKIDNRTYLISARLEISYLNKTYDWNLPVGDYDTLNGLILAYTEEFPIIGQTVSISPFTFKIESTKDNRIETVRMTIKEVEDQAS
ncbi:MAG TPA: hemolysin family protein [Cyclobacteriaceae bacterium]